MRLDLFLKQTGLVKRRPIAKAMCDSDKIVRNGKAARAGDEVRRHDILVINYGAKTTEVEVLEVPPPVVSRTARHEFYRIVREERDESELRARLVQRTLQRDEPMF